MSFLILNNFNNRKQRVKMNSSFSSFQKIITGVPQGSLLGPLLFNKFLTYIFLLCPIEIPSYGDGSTPYAVGDFLRTTCQNVEEATNILLKCFANICMSQMQPHATTNPLTGLQPTHRPAGRSSTNPMTTNTWTINPSTTDHQPTNSLTHRPLTYQLSWPPTLWLNKLVLTVTTGLILLLIYFNLPFGLGAIYY